MPITNKRASAAIANAAQINRSIKGLQHDLDLLKQVIREEAEKHRTGDEMVEFDSPEGVASVVLVADALEAIEGANLLELEEKLPSVTWDDLFAVSVKPVSDFTAKFEVLATPLKRVLKCYVQWVPRAPRVTLPK